MRIQPRSLHSLEHQVQVNHNLEALYLEPHLVEAFLEIQELVLEDFLLILTQHLVQIFLDLEVSLVELNLQVGLYLHNQVSSIMELMLMVASLVDSTTSKRKMMMKIMTVGMMMMLEKEVEALQPIMRILILALIKRMEKTQSFRVRPQKKVPTLRYITSMLTNSK